MMTKRSVLCFSANQCVKLAAILFILILLFNLVVNNFNMKEAIRLYSQQDGKLYKLETSVNLMRKEASDRIDRLEERLNNTDRMIQEKLTTMTQPTTSTLITRPSEIINSSIIIYDYEINENKVTNHSFQCVKSARVVVQTTICIHSILDDIFVSKSIQMYGAWERDVLSVFMRLLEADQKLQVLDVGANLGQYSLFAAKLGRTCVAVEPFSENYIRLHASARAENITDKIILVTNGVSDRSGERKILEHSRNNIGGQSIKVDYQIIYNNKSKTRPGRKRVPRRPREVVDDKFSLVTIVLDDLVPILPDHFKHAVLKIDIEGYEFKAFKSASRLLETIDIPVIFMEWLGKDDPDRFSDEETESFLRFMYSSGYTCRSLTTFNELSQKIVRSWPKDVIWVKNVYHQTLLNLIPHYSYGISIK